MDLLYIKFEKFNVDEGLLKSSLPIISKNLFGILILLNADIKSFIPLSLIILPTKRMINLSLIQYLYLF